MDIQKEEEGVVMYSTTSLERNRRSIQSSTSQRWEQLSLIREVLEGYPRKATFRQLRECMFVAGELGSGVYGNVYEMCLRAPHCYRMPYSFAMKMVHVNNVNRSQREETVTRVLREIHAFSYTNGLVYLNICPNFTLAPRTFFAKARVLVAVHPENDDKKTVITHRKNVVEEERLAISKGNTVPAATVAVSPGAKQKKNKNMLCCMIIMERESGTVRDWLKMAKPGSLRTADVMEVMLQVFMAICAMGKHLELCHNDMYFKNILYSQCDSREMVYKLAGAQYTIRRCKMLVKITDFGIATSPKVLFKSHTDLTHLVRGNLHVSSHSEIEFTHHILDYENVQPYARDPAVVLRTLTLMSSLSQKVKTWALKGLLILDDLAADGQRMHHWKGVVDLTGRLFHPDFLSSCEIEPNMFSPVRSSSSYCMSSVMPPTPHPPLSTGPTTKHQPAATEYFDVDGARVGNDEQISELLTAQAKYFHGKK